MTSGSRVYMWVLSVDMVIYLIDWLYPFAMLLLGQFNNGGEYKIGENVL